jgi:hypothetical protein
VGDTLVICNDGVCRFTGRITDIRMDHLKEAQQAVTTVIAIGKLARLGFTLTGGNGFNAETVRERAEEVLTDGGIPFLNGGTTLFNLGQVASSDAEPVDVLSYLSELARWSGATYFDTPGGTVVFESYGVRGQTANPGIWAARPGTWATQLTTWNALPVDHQPVTLPPDAVVWSPQWTRALDGVINDVTITHGTTLKHSDRYVDPDSITDYGDRAITIVTELDDHTDAQQRAAGILLAQARPLWNLGQVTVLMDRLPTAVKAQTMALLSGSTVIVTGLPATAPETQWGGIVEGWSETYTPGLYVMTLSLSDRRYSYQTAEWADVDPALSWQNVNSTVEWFNVVTAGDLI